jgi:hypothetical protein
MSITQERMTTLLLTIKHLKDSHDVTSATLQSYLRSSTDPHVLLTMLSELVASQKLPDNLYENYVSELAHFKARGKINLAKRRYNEKKSLLATGQALTGRGIDGLKLEHAQRAQAREQALAQPDKRQGLIPPPADTPREEILSWERYHNVKYDWSQWTGPQAQAENWSLKEETKLDHTIATTVKAEDGVLILADDVDFPPDEVDGQEDEGLDAAQQAFIASQAKYQSKS